MLFEARSGSIGAGARGDIARARGRVTKLSDARKAHTILTVVMLERLIFEAAPLVGLLLLKPSPRSARPQRGHSVAKRGHRRPLS